MNPLLYGSDPEERLVGLHRVGEGLMRLYTRHEDGRVTHRDERFRPFAVLSDEGMDFAEGAFARLDSTVLDGEHHYRHLVNLDSWRDHWQLKKALRDEYDNNRIELRPMYSPPTPEAQYLMRTGKTLFKGMHVGDVRRMQIDIETYSPHGFPNADKWDHKIIILALTDSSGYEKVLHLKHAAVNGFSAVHESCDSEAELLRAFVREIHRRNPDVLELHYGFGFDLPYIMKRAAMHGVNLAIGRDQKEPRSWETVKKIAEREFAYTNYAVGGRAVIDTMFLSAEYDVFTRALPDLKLKGVADYFRQEDGVTYEEMMGRERVYVAGDDIARTWDEDPTTLLEYALDDVRETQYLAEKLGAATFYVTQMVPMTFQQCHLAGMATTIENLMVRTYLEAGHSLPYPEYGGQEVGGLTQAFYTGRFRNLVYADVNSLYPAVMINYRCEPESDTLDVFHRQLVDLTDMRLKTKAAAAKAKKAGDKSMASALKAQEQSYKVLINSHYGAMGFDFFLFNDFSEADRVAQTGQDILRLMKSKIEERGGTVIEMDTDGVLFTAPESLHGDLAGQEALVDSLTKEMPKGIVIGMDGLYDVMISYRKKNYALRDYDGKVKVTGGAFKSRGLEPFMREYVQTQLDHLMDGDVRALHMTHEGAKEMLYKRMVPVEQLAVRKTLKDSITTYENKVDDGGNRQAQYEVAIKEGAKVDRRPERGDTASYYVSGDSPAYKVRSFADARPLSEYTRGSENVRWYIHRLQKTADRFKVFFHDDDFGKVFVSPPRSSKGQEFTLPLFDLSFDLSGVQILNRPVEDVHPEAV